MALVSTAGAANADSYFSLTEADSYFSARGISDWTGTEGAKENAARRGTTYLDNQYRDRWVGLRSEQTQSLAWPRCNSEWVRTGLSVVRSLFDTDGFEIPTDEVPTQVKHAAMEAALLALTGVTLEPRLDRGGQIKSIGKSVGSLRKDVVYMDGAPVVDRYTVIEGLLRGLVKSHPGASSGTVNLVRA
jgi:hypothetical protein